MDFVKGNSLHTGVQLFDGKDYLLWSSLMRSVIVAKGLDSVLSNDKPVKEEELKQWKKQDDQVRAIILLSLDREIARGVIHLKTANEVWKKLEQLHHRKSAANKIQLQQDFYETKMNPGMKISEYISKIESIVAQLKDFGEEISDDALIAKIVTGLQTDYKHFMSAWLGTPANERTLDSLLPRLLAEEQLLEQTDEPKAGKALKVSTGNFRRADKAKKFNGECYYCHKKGHRKAQCRQRIQEESTSKIDEPQATDKRRALTARVFKAEVSQTDDDYCWFLDSGASAHMTKHFHWLKNYKQFSKKVPVRVGNNEFIYGLGSGIVDVVSQVDGKDIEFTIENVMFVPDISENLFSQGAADAKGAIIKSQGGRISISDDLGVLVTGQKDHGNLYKLNMDVQLSAMISRAERTLDEWHEVIGHADKRQIENMAKEGIVEGLKIVEKPKDLSCGSCQLGKGHHATHATSGRSRATKILERIHVDLVGKITPTSSGGNNYFMLIRDEYSSYLTVRCLASKTHVLNALRSFVLEESSKMQTKVKIIRSDNGTEFRNQGMKVLCEMEGIVQEFSAPNTPQQNGEIERANRTVIETARTMLQSAELPLNLWAEAVDTAVYLRNRTTNTRASDMTPYEIYYGRKPDLAHLMKFGQEIHVLNHERGISKFSAKTTEAYLIGYGQRVNTYKCLLPGTSDIIVTSDVVPASHRSATRLQKQQNRPLIPFMIERQEIERETTWQRSHEETEGSNEPPNQQLGSGIDLPEVSEDAAREQCTLQQDVASNSGAASDRITAAAEINSRIPIRVDPHQRRENLTTQSECLSRANTAEDTERGADSQQVVGASSTAPSGVQGAAIRRAQRNVNSIYMRKHTANVASVEPRTFGEAVSAEDSKDWITAIEAELEAHKRNQTWKLVPKSPKIKEITAKWVFKVKHDTAGNIERYKARLVARGFSQVAGLDYTEIFAPVVRMDSVRLLFSLCAQYNLKYVQFDVATAFLNGDVKEELYLTPPEGLEVPEGYTCRLVKSLYGLKQSPRCWNDKFAEMLKIFNMEQTYSDPCVYVGREPELIYLALYVDDGLVFAEKQGTIDRLIGYLTKHFEIKTVRSSCFIGVQIERNVDKGCIFLHQSGYIKRMLERFGMTDAKGKATPLEAGHSLNKPEVLDKDPVENVPYSEAIGSIMHCLGTRPDLAHVMSVLSKYNSCPREQHWIAVKRVFKYLKATQDYGLLYKRVDAPSISCYTDADWAGDQDSRRSVSGMISFISSGPVSYKAQQQPVVALSTTEAEYIAATIAVKELVWLKRFMEELQVPLKDKSLLHCDNQSALRLIKNPEYHQRTKHIDIRYHFIREKYSEGCFEPVYIETDDQKADIFTKALDTRRFQRLRDMIGCVSFGSEHQE